MYFETYSSNRGSILRMTERERKRQHYIDAIRGRLSIAAAGISVGAALTVLIPADIMRFAGFGNVDQTVAAKITFIAALVWLAARASIIIRWK
jgi:hypothetical protein